MKTNKSKNTTRPKTDERMLNERKITKTNHDLAQCLFWTIVLTWSYHGIFILSFDSEYMYTAYSVYNTIFNVSFISKSNEKWQETKMPALYVTLSLWVIIRLYSILRVWLHSANTNTKKHKDVWFSDQTFQWNISRSLYEYCVVRGAPYTVYAICYKANNVQFV